MEWYLKVLKQFSDFNGRARRKEYWMFVLINIAISIGIGFVDGILGTTNELGMGYLGLLYSLAVIIPGIAVGVRRLHDIGKSGWMLLVAFIPFIGFIWLIILMAREGDEGENEYGSNPKERELSWD